MDLRDELHGEVFEPLRDVDLFRAVRLDPDMYTVTWPTGADLAPEHLHELLRTAPRVTPLATGAAGA